MRIDELKLPQWFKSRAAPTPAEPIQLLTRDNWAALLTAAIQQARAEILLTQYSISNRWTATPDDSNNVWRALLAAPARGIPCRAILAQHRKTAATVRFNEFAQAHLVKAGWSVRRAKPSKLLHAKLTIIDRSLIICGSHNMAQCSASTNIDLSLALSGEQTALPFVHFFDALWSYCGQTPTAKPAAVAHRSIPPDHHADDALAV